MPEQLVEREIRDQAAGLFSKSGGLGSFAPGEQLIGWFDGTAFQDRKAWNGEDALGIEGGWSPEAVAFPGEDTEEG
ncbi:MAG: hypothetical protein QOH06_3490 [Acidobacteriota bacterium]|nr:hypothetical protein [Acidobacteriota bacterium]